MPKAQKIESVSLTPADLSNCILLTLEKLQQDGILPAGELPETVTVERPKNRDHGDWATNVAMQVAGRLGIAPREMATALAGELSSI